MCTNLKDLEKQNYGLMVAQAIGELRNGMNFKTIDFPHTIILR